MQIRQYGHFPHDVWRPTITPIAEVEVEGDTTAKEVIDFIKAECPDIPRHEIALVGWPEQREFDLERLIPVETTGPEVILEAV